MSQPIVLKSILEVLTLSLHLFLTTVTQFSQSQISILYYHITGHWRKESELYSMYSEEGNFPKKRS
jgi:hypothetical protein